MEKRVYKNSKDAISLLGLGTMRFPIIGEDSKNIDEKKAEEIIDYAYRHGVNYFDTAYPYHKQMSELVVGRALKKYPRESFYLADKMPGWMVKSLDDVKRIFYEQLEKCQVDYFDFYLCHALSAEEIKIYEKLGIIAWLNERRNEGVIRHLGFSFHDTPAVLEKIVAMNDWDFAQIQLNYLDWHVQDAKGQYDVLTKHGLPCVVMEPVRGGTLAKLSQDSKAYLQEKEPDKSLASWAIRYAASLPNVMTVLSGMSTIEQVKDNVATMTNFSPLNDAEYAAVQTAVSLYKKNVTIGCTGCRYCMDCPSGVDIPLVFSLYNAYAVEHNKEKFLKAYGEIKEAHGAQHCVSCGRCAKHCPQKIDIPSHMRRIKELVESLEK